MPKILNIADANFNIAFGRLLSARTDIQTETIKRAAKIVNDVKMRGDEALFELTKKLDHTEIDTNSIYISRDEIIAASDTISDDCKESIKIAIERIDAYHRLQIPENKTIELDGGEVLGWNWNPIESVGIYVPGGSASYPSSVLMNAIPAKVASVSNITMAVPTPNGIINPLVLYSAQAAGVDRIIRVGGAQAVAALAYGTQSVRPVDKITGPGNAYVAAAKRIVYGDVGVDIIAGPSEVVVLADDTANPDWIAADLLAQAEHDASAQSILVTTSTRLTTATVESIERQLSTLSRRSIAAASWQQHGAIIKVRDLAELVDIANKIAPEHLQICTKNPATIMTSVRHAGAIFLGSWTPEAIGDYIAGPSHVLPTNGSARFASGLSVLDYMKKTSVIRMSPASFAQIAPPAEVLAISEGLDAHARSLRIRLQSLNENLDG